MVSFSFAFGDGLGQRLIIGIADSDGSEIPSFDLAHSTVGILSKTLGQILAHIAGERAAGDDCITLCVTADRTNISLKRAAEISSLPPLNSISPVMVPVVWIFTVGIS